MHVKSLTTVGVTEPLAKLLYSCNVLFPRTLIFKLKNAAHVLDFETTFIHDEPLG